MTDWYVSPDGRDSNAGTSAAAPLKSITFAEAVLSASDNIMIVGTEKASPLRHNQVTHNSATLMNHLQVGTACTIKNGESAHQYYATSVDITDGTDRGNYIIDPSFEAWPSASALHFWGIEAGTIEKETTEVASGYTTSVHTPVGAGSGSYSGVKIDVRLPKNTTFAVEAIARNVEISTRAIVTVRDTGAGESVDFDPSSASTWGAEPADNYIGSTGANTFEYFTDNFPSPYNQFTTQNTGTYDITLQNNSGTDRESYLQFISITNVDHPNYTWVADSEADVYYMPAMHFQPKIILVTPTADWNANGVVGFDDLNANYAMKSTQAAMNAAEESAWWDSTNDRIYIHIPAGTSISDYHIEACANSPCVEFTADCSLYNITFAMGRGVLVSAGVTNGISGYNAHTKNCVFDAFKMNAGGDNQLYSCSAWRNRGDFGVSTDTDGFVAVNSGTVLKTYGCTAQHVLDEGFEAASGADVYCYGCLADGTGTEGEAAAIGFKITVDAGGNGYFYNCTAINCAGDAFKNELTGAGNFTMKGCITNQNVNLNATGTVTYDVDECIAASAGDTSGAWAGGTNNQTLAAANIKLNTDGSLQSDFTEAVGTGTPFWTLTNPRPPSASGEPFPDQDMDKGGMQSTHSALHPVNI